MLQESDPHVLADISPEAYRHPFDRGATAALQKIPHFDTVLRRILGLGLEQRVRADLLASCIRLGENQLPDVWERHRRVFEILDMEPVPELYLHQEPAINAFAVGTRRPVVVVNSQLVDVLDGDSEALQAILGHEAGHIHCQHAMYGTVLSFLAGWGTALAPSMLAGLPVQAIVYALRGWSRAAELSCDRAAAITTRSPEAVCRALMAITAGTATAKLNVDAFIEQGMDYESSGSSLIRLRADWRSTHPLTVRRVRALMDWVGAGDYEKVVNGEYLTRREEGAFRDEAMAAAMRDAAEIDRLAEEDGESFGEIGNELEMWLEDNPDGSPDSADDRGRTV